MSGTPVRTRATFLAGGTAAAAIGAGAYRANAQVGATAVVRLGSIPTDDMTPVLYAQKAGLFQKAGLDVQISVMTSGAAVTAGVLAGALDVGKSSLINLFSAHQRDLPITLLAASTLYNPKAPYNAFIVAEDSPIHTGADFNGATVALLALGDIGSVALPAWVDQHGGDSRTLQFVEVPVSAANAAVEQHRVAAAETGEPYLAAALAGGKMRAIHVFDSIPAPYALSAWFTTRDFSARRPEVIRAFAHAYAEAAAYANKHQAETAPMIAEFTHTPIDIVRKMNRSIAGITLQSSQLQPEIDLCVKYGVLKRRFLAEEMIDPNVASR